MLIIEEIENQENQCTMSFDSISVMVEQQSDLKFNFVFKKVMDQFSKGRRNVVKIELKPYKKYSVSSFDYSLISLNHTRFNQRVYLFTNHHRV